MPQEKTQPEYERMEVSCTLVFPVSKSQIENYGLDDALMSNAHLIAEIISAGFNHHVEVVLGEDYGPAEEGQVTSDAG